jgi:N-acetylglucosamine transport system substrate-binding protein
MAEVHKGGIFMKSKKVISSLLVAAMSASLLAGCGGSGDKPAESKPADNTTADNATDTTPAEPAESKPAETPETTSADENTPVEEQTLKVAAFEGGYGADMWSEVTAAFEASHPGVTVELTIDKKLEDVISPAMKAGDYPDVVHLATGREAALTETLTKEKALLPLTDVLEMTVPGENVKVKDKIVPGFLDTLATNPYGDGVTYYAPMFYSPCGLFYNAGLFKEKG